jgi:hypothetical protein
MHTPDWASLASIHWVAVAVLACSSGERPRSPTCGIALVVGPTLVQQQMLNLRALIVDAPAGLPAALPARVADRADPGGVLVEYEDGRLLLEFQGVGFPSRPGYALLVVDDTSQQVEGVLIYDQDGPRDHPRIGTVRRGEVAIPLYGVLVDWGSVSNPRCPLLGLPTAPAARDS